MQTVIFGDNVLDSDTWVTEKVTSVHDFLISKFGDILPETVSIYEGAIARENIINPKCEAEIDYMNSIEDNVYILVHPGDPISIIVAVVVAVVAVGAALLLAPKIPNLDGRNNTSQSSNNELSSRANKARIGGRIPDIFGQVRSYPDLIAAPYKVFIGNIEYETTFMCVGKGHYELDDIREGDTLINSIPGSKVAFYEPFTSPNKGVAQLSIGGAIGDPLLDIKRVEAYNGQVLKSVTAVERGFSSWLQFYNDGSNQGINFNPSAALRNISYGFFGTDDYEDSFVTGNFEDGQRIEIVDDVYGGTYTILTTLPTSIILDNPAAVNPAWSSLTGTTGQDNAARVIAPDPLALPPYISDKKDADTFIVNVVGLNGLYKEDSEAQISNSVTYQIKLTPIDLNDNAIGPAETFTDIIIGSSTEKDKVGKTTYCKPSFVGRCSILISRITPTDTVFEGNVVDEIKIKDFYAAKRVPDNTDFGNITTCHSNIKATDGALAVKERRLSLLATRKLPKRLIDNTFDENDLVATKKFSDILAFVTLDPYIGRRQPNQLNIEHLYEVQSEIEEYFSLYELDTVTLKPGQEIPPTAIEKYDGSDFSEFNYTFDNNNMTYEETANIICGAVYCTPFRRWNLIDIIFEKIEDTPSMVFSHRNKIPGTETRLYKFGVDNDFDGVEVTYISPIDDSQHSIKVPNDLVTNPKKVDLVGVRHARLAYVHAWRLWNKVIFNYLTTEFEATGEANVLLRNDNVLISDNTTPVTFDGEIEDQFELTLKLSQNIALDTTKDYYITVQHYNKSTETVKCVSSSSGLNYVTLVTPLSYELNIDENNYGRASFIIAEEDVKDTERFIVVENSLNSNMSSNLKAINYDERYYANDYLSSNAPDLDITGPGQQEPEAVDPVEEPPPVEPPVQPVLPPPPPPVPPFDPTEFDGDFFIDPDGQQN